MDDTKTTGVEANLRVQFALAAFMWTAASVMLGVRGAGWLAHAHFGLALAALALTLGWLKQRFIMSGVARGAVERIRARDPRASALGFFSVKTWLTIAVMMGAGIALRVSGVLPPTLLGTLYTTVATGLLLGSRTFWIAAVHAA
ncbi:MAG: hypothetical protein FD171_581 [Actinobacteria bacterium]|nr:MAG: hypothetical protein FD171_581 [Actinomycetota bacterium]MDO8948941.1 hypothetical protein [Actinomycetota bacterium]